jgi:hypothetical protein
MSGVAAAAEKLSPRTLSLTRTSMPSGVSAKTLSLCQDDAEAGSSAQSTWARSRQTVELPLACKLPRYRLGGHVYLPLIVPLLNIDC